MEDSGAMSMQERYTSGQYLEDHPTWHVEESAGKIPEIVRILARNGLAPRSVCDIGCGAGEVLRLLQPHLPEGADLVGYDISPAALALATSRANAHLRFVQGDLPHDPSEHYDLALLMDVLEHVEDYFTLLRRLKPKADYILVFFPLDLSAQTVMRPHALPRIRDAHAHLHYFTKETALLTLEDTGYSIADAFYTADMLNLPTQLWGRRLIKYPRKLLFALHQDFAVHLLGGYRLLALAH